MITQLQQEGLTYDPRQNRNLIPVSDDPVGWNETSADRRSNGLDGEMSLTPGTLKQGLSFL
jgi:hypothetical protein